MKLFGAVIVHYFDLVAQVRRKENHCWTTSSFPCHPANRTNQFANCGWPIIVCGVLKDLRELVKNPQYIIVYKGYYFVIDSHIYFNFYWLNCIHNLQCNRLLFDGGVCSSPPPDPPWYAMLEVPGAG